MKRLGLDVPQATEMAGNRRQGSICRRHPDVEELLTVMIEIKNLNYIIRAPRMKIRLRDINLQIRKEFIGLTDIRIR